MVGLDKFREAFKEYANNYVIIGGTACDIAMTGTAVRPRATHDIDMIVIVENMTPQFGQKFWEFVREAGYRPERHKTADSEPAKYELYRFVDGKPGYPEMIEEAVGNSNAKHKIVVTHHVPSFRMLCPKFKDSNANGAFTVELGDYIEHSGIEYWIYGHSHYNVDVTIGATQCVSNQLGYVFNNEHNTFNPKAIIDI